MFTQPVVRTYAAPQRGAMFIEPVLRAYAAPQRGAMGRSSSRAFDAQLITLHPAGVRHGKQRAPINIQLLTGFPAKAMGFAIPSCWRTIRQANYKTGEL